MPYWYHGTTRENAQEILDDGFRAGTHFARNMETALFQGGDFIFEVFFEEDPSTYWQWVCPEVVPVSEIHLLIQTSPVVLYRSEEVEIRIDTARWREEDPTYTVCMTCRGRGQMEDYPPLVRRRDRETCTACPDCHGYGSVEKYQVMQAGT